LKFCVRFYAKEEGERPVLDFLESLRTTHPVLHKLVTAGLRKLQNRAMHGPPLTARVEGTDGIYELRVGGADIARTFFFFQLYSALKNGPICGPNGSQSWAHLTTGAPRPTVRGDRPVDSGSPSRLNPERR
jgi:hypothetical protein